jgi:mannose-6-phosphate isomerase-like protein (cupin superfamily)
MKKAWILALVTIPLFAVRSQSPVTSGFAEWTGATVKDTDHALAAQAASDPHRVAFRQLADFPNDALLQVHREDDGTPEVHETQVDVMFVRSGTATLIVGGTLQNGQTTAPHEIRNGTIQGGVRHKLSPGDVVRIPANTPHQVVLDGGHEFTYFVVKVKGY